MNFSWALPQTFVLCAAIMSHVELPGRMQCMHASGDSPGRVVCTLHMHPSVSDLMDWTATWSNLICRRRRTTGTKIHWNLELLPQASKLSFLCSGQQDHQLWKSGGPASILVVQRSFGPVLTKLHSEVYNILAKRKKLRLNNCEQTEGLLPQLS